MSVEKSSQATLYQDICHLKIYICQQFRLFQTAADSTTSVKRFTIWRATTKRFSQSDETGGKDERQEREMEEMGSQSVQENLHWRFWLHLDFSAAAEPASGSVWMPASVELRFWLWNSSRKNVFVQNRTVLRRAPTDAEVPSPEFWRRAGWSSSSPVSWGRWEHLPQSEQPSQLLCCQQWFLRAWLLVSVPLWFLQPGLVQLRQGALGWPSLDRQPGSFVGREEHVWLCLCAWWKGALVFPTLDLKMDMNPDLEAGFFSWAGGGGSGLGAASKVPVFEGSTFWCQQSRSRKTHIASWNPERKIFRDVKSEREPPPGRKRWAQKSGKGQISMQ